MNNKKYIIILIAAVLVGAFFGAIVSLVPQFTLSMNATDRLVVDAVAAVVAGVVMICYIKFVQRVKRSNHK